MAGQHTVLCASGVLGPPGESGVDEVLSYGAGLPADGIEFLVRNSHRGRLDQLLPLLRTSGLNFPVVHLAKGVAARLPAQEARIELTENLRFAAALGAKLGVLHLWDLPHSDRNFNGRLAAYGLASELASEHGIEVGIESIPCTVASPLRNLRRILDRHPDAALVYDTEFLAPMASLMPPWTRPSSGPPFGTSTSRTSTVASPSLMDEGAGGALVRGPSTSAASPPRSDAMDSSAPYRWRPALTSRSMARIGRTWTVS